MIVFLRKLLLDLYRLAYEANLQDMDIESRNKTLADSYSNIINEFGIIQILLTLMDSFDEIQKLDSNGNLIFTENGPMLEKSERTETLDSKEVPFNLDPFYFLAKIPGTSIPLDFKTGEFFRNRLFLMFNYINFIH